MMISTHLLTSINPNPQNSARIIINAMISCPAFPGMRTSSIYWSRITLRYTNKGCYILVAVLKKTSEYIWDIAKDLMYTNRSGLVSEMFVSVWENQVERGIGIGAILSQTDEINDGLQGYKTQVSK